MRKLIIPLKLRKLPENKESARGPFFLWNPLCKFSSYTVQLKNLINIFFNDPEFNSPLWSLDQAFD